MGAWGLQQRLRPQGSATRLPTPVMPSGQRAVSKPMANLHAIRQGSSSGLALDQPGQRQTKAEPPAPEASIEDPGAVEVLLK